MDVLLNTPIPKPWTIACTQEGRIYFINDDLKTTTWLHPHFKQTVQSGHFPDQYVPDDCEKDFSEDHQTYYIDHMRRTTSWQIPTDKPLVSLAEPQKKSKVQTSSLKRSNSAKRRSLKQKVPDARRNPNSVVVARNWLYRQEGGPGLLKSWKKRWCVLADLCLFVYKGPEEGSPLSSILLPSYNISSCPKDNHKYVFKVGHENVKSAYFSCESVKETEEWMGEMRLASLAVQPSKEINGGGGMSEGNGEVGYYGGSGEDGGHNGVNAGDGGDNFTTVDKVVNQGLMNYNVKNSLVGIKSEDESEMNKRNVPNMFVNNNNTNYNNEINDNMDEYNNPAIKNDSKYNIKTVLNEFKNDMLTKHQDNSEIRKQQQQNYSKQQYAQQHLQQQQSVPVHKVVAPSSSYNNDDRNNNIINNNLKNNNIPINNLNNNLDLSSQTPQLNITDYPRKVIANNTRQQLVDWNEDLDSSRVIERYELDQASVQDFSKDVLNKSQLKNIADEIEESNIENVDVVGIGHGKREINKLNNIDDYTKNDVIKGVSALNNVSSNGRNESALNMQKGSESVKSGRMSEENLKKIPGSEKNSFKGGVIYPGVSNMVYPSQTSESFERVKEWTESQKRFNQENAKIGVCDEFVNYDTAMSNQEEFKNDFYLNYISNKNELIVKSGQSEEKDLQTFNEDNLPKSQTGYNNDVYNVNGVSMSKESKRAEVAVDLNDLGSDLKNNADLVTLASKLYDCNETDEIVENLVKLRRAQYRLHEHSYKIISLSYKKPLQVDLKKQRMILDSQMKESSEVIRKLESCLQINARNLSDDDLIHRQHFPYPHNQANTDAGLRVQTDLNLIDNKNEKFNINPTIEDPSNNVLTHKKATISPKPHPNSIQPSSQPPLQSLLQPPSQEINALLQQPQHSPLQQQQPLSPISHISNIDSDILRNKISILPTNPQGFMNPLVQTASNSNHSYLTNQLSGTFIETDLDLMKSINTAMTSKEQKFQLPSQFIHPGQASNTQMKPKTNYTATTCGMNNVLESNGTRGTNYFENNGLAKINSENNDLEISSYMNELIKRSKKTTPLIISQTDHNTRAYVAPNDLNNFRGDISESAKHHAHLSSNKGHFYQSPVNQRTSQHQQVSPQQPNSNQKTQTKAHESVKTYQQPSFKPFQPKSYPIQQGIYSQNHQNNLNPQNFPIINSVQETQKAISQHPNLHTSQHPNLHTSHTNQSSQNIGTFKTKDEEFSAKSYPDNHKQVDLNNNTNSSLNDNYRKYKDNNNYNFNNKNTNSFNNNNFKDYNNNYNTRNHPSITNSTSQQPSIHSETELKQQHIVRSFESKPSEASPAVPIEAIPKDTMVRSDWNPMKASRSFQDLKKQCEEEEKEDNAIGGDDDGVIRGGLRNKRHIRRLSGIFTPRPFYKSNPSVGGDNDMDSNSGNHAGTEVVGRNGIGSEDRCENERNENYFGDKVNKGTFENRGNNTAFGGDESRFCNVYNDRKINFYDDNVFDKAVVDVKSEPKENELFSNNGRNKMFVDGNRSENESNGRYNNIVGFNGGGGNIEKWLSKRTENIKIIGNSKNNSDPSSLLYSTKNEQLQTNSGNSFKMNTDDGRKHTDVNNKYGNNYQSKVSSAQNEFDIMSALQTPAQICLPSRTFQEPPYEDEGEDNDDNNVKRKEKTAQLTRLLAMQSMTDYSGGEDKRNIRNGGRKGVGAGIDNPNNYHERFVMETRNERMDGKEMMSNVSMRNRFREGGVMGANDLMVSERTSGREIDKERKLRAEEERRRRQEVLNVKGELARQASFKARSERRNRH